MEAVDYPVPLHVAIFAVHYLVVASWSDMDISGYASTNNNDSYALPSYLFISKN